MGRVGGGVQLESELVCWECCDHADDEGDEEGRVARGHQKAGAVWIGRM